MSFIHRFNQIGFDHVAPGAAQFHPDIVVAEAKHRLACRFQRLFVLPLGIPLPEAKQGKQNTDEECAFHGDVLVVLLPASAGVTEKKGCFVFVLYVDTSRKVNVKNGWKLVSVVYDLFPHEEILDTVFGKSAGQQNAIGRMIFAVGSFNEVSSEGGVFL